MDIRSARREGIRLLTDKGESAANLFIPSPTSSLDIDCILAFITGRGKSHLIAHSSDILSEDEITRFNAAVALRRTGLPVAYITGKKEFYGRDFTVTPDVLIPKPDTELLVEHAVEYARSMFTDSNITQELNIADICTGSGCIGISVLCEIEKYAEKCNFILTDISSKALDVARENARKLVPSEFIKSVDFKQGDLCAPLPENMQFHMILSNPPYIPAAEVTELLKDGRNEPRIALDGDTDTAVSSENKSSDGLAVIRRLIPQVLTHLAAGGIFFLETGEYNAEKAAELMKLSGFSSVKTYTDLSGQLRLTEGTK